MVSLTQFRTTARVSVANAGSVPLEDVAMTLPGVLLAETPDGTALEVHVPQQGPAAVRIGRLEPGAQYSFAAWTTDAADQPGTAGAIRLGAAGGAEGVVSLYGAEGWLGEEPAVRPWARWLVGSVLVAAALAAFGVLVLIVAGALSDRRRAGTASRA